MERGKKEVGGSERDRHRHEVDGRSECFLGLRPGWLALLSSGKGLALTDMGRGCLPYEAQGL